MTRLLKENVSIVTYELLKFNKVLLTESYLKIHLYSHPNSHSLVSVNDMLREHKIVNSALRVGYSSS
jgi:hypothetical protein